MRFFAICVVVVAIVVVAVALGILYRNRQMDRLYAEASGQPPFVVGSREATAAVSKLASYHNGRSSRLLIALALGRNQGAFSFGDAQIEAIKVLRESDDPTVPVALASLLQPQEGIDIRKAAANSLQHLPCTGECIRSVLYYLERVWRGDLNYEDMLAAPDDNPSTSFKKEQKELYDALYSVLTREKSQTIDNLKYVYGMGSVSPSRFMLELLPRLGMVDACPLLLDSDRNINGIPPGFFHGPREELQSAIASLHCS